MTDAELGYATIVYDDPDEGRVETQVENEHIAYFDDHWLVKTGEDSGGNDLVRRIPRKRVHYVERSVEEFEDRVDRMVDEVKGRFDLG